MEEDMNSISAQAILLVALCALVPPTGGAAAADGGGSASAMTAREEIHRTFRLDRGARVRVEGIAGPVSIETADGDGAQVHIVRLAASQRELGCYRTAVAGGGAALAIEHVQDTKRPGCDSIRSRQEVRLVLPRTVDVHLSTIAGGVDIAPIDGRVSLDSIAGRVTVAGARSAEMDSLAGGLAITLRPLAAAGVRVSSVVGAVDLTFPSGVNADVRLDSVMGSVRGVPAELDRNLIEEQGAYRLRVGTGGPKVILSSVVGPVRLRRP
jgi:hypothetical protein